MFAIPVRVKLPAIMPPPIVHGVKTIAITSLPVSVAEMTIPAVAKSVPKVRVTIAVGPEKSKIIPRVTIPQRTAVVPG